MSGKFDIDALRARLRRLMDDHQTNNKRLAKDAGLGETSIRDIFDEKRQDVRVGTLLRIADFFDLGVDDLLDDQEMPIAGRIGAGGAIVFSDDENLSDAPMVRRPAGATGRIMALEVVGNSMWPKYEDGDVIYVRRPEFDGVPKNAIGQHCAVRTEDGGTYLKILAKGEKGRFTLRSLNAPDMEEVEVTWAAPVRWMMPKAAREL